MTTAAAWSITDRPFLAFTPEIRKVIYTTNQIESINYQLRKITKTRGSFPSAEAAILAPKPELIARLEENGLVVVPSIGAARHTGQVATTLLLFLLTSDSRVPDAVKTQYLEKGLQDTVVSTRVDGMPHRVLRTGLVNALESCSPLNGMAAAVQNANKFKSMTGMKWQQLAKDGLNMRKASDRTWQQIVMAANTPMLLKAGLVEGNTEAGVLASYRRSGLPARASPAGVRGAAGRHRGGLLMRGSPATAAPSFFTRPRASRGASPHRSRDRAGPAPCAPAWRRMAGDARELGSGAHGPRIPPPAPARAPGESSVRAAVHDHLRNPGIFFCREETRRRSEGRRSPPGAPGIRR